MHLEYKRSEIGEIDGIMRIYEQAQEFMESQGNPQWEKGFPAKTDICGGIYGGVIYSVYCDNMLSAVFAVINHDGIYDKIEGEWLTSENYLAVHRVAVGADCRGKGIAKYIINTAVPEIARARGRSSIRMDTHEKNTPMRALLSSQGFKECGTVYTYRDSTPRLAFEKLL